MDKTIVAYVIKKLDRTILDQWIEIAFNTIESWNDDQPYLALHDLSHSGVVMLYWSISRHKLLNIAVHPTGENRLEKIIKAKPAFKAKVAVCTSSNFSGNLGNTIATLSARQPSSGFVTYRSFFEQGDALDWLNNDS